MYQCQDSQTPMGFEFVTRASCALITRRSNKERLGEKAHKCLVKSGGGRKRERRPFFASRDTFVLTPAASLGCNRFRNRYVDLRSVRPSVRLSSRIRLRFYLLNSTILRLEDEHRKNPIRLSYAIAQIFYPTIFIEYFIDTLNFIQ